MSESYYVSDIFTTSYLCQIISGYVYIMSHLAGGKWFMLKNGQIKADDGSSYIHTKLFYECKSIKLIEL